jgi:hypothetical protein
MKNQPSVLKRSRNSSESVLNKIFYTRGSQTFCFVDHLPIFSVFRRPLPRGRSKPSQAV